MQKFYLSAYAKPSLGGLATGSATHGYGHWMPEDVSLRRAWLSHLLEKAKPEIPPKLRDGKENPVDALRNLIENNSTLYMLAHSMFDEVPEKAPYDRDPTTLKKQVRNYKTMLYLFNTLLTEVPEYFLVNDPNVPSGLIGFPFNVIVDWPMGTQSGRQFFLDPRVNESLKAILNKWNEFLSNPNGRTGQEGGGNQALIEAGWSSDIAVQQLEKKANDATPDNKRRFTDLFEHPAGGTQENFFNYPHWDAFFTRKFKDGVRPVGNGALVNACESFPLSFDTDVSGRTTFWLKGMPYSLHDMLGATQDDRVSQYVDKFVGGTVYQAFLSADSYHCWNAPVNGTVVYRSLIDGTYFAETAASGFGGSSGPDPAGPDMSQRYITHIAARGVLIVDTNVENGSQIGFVGFVPVGMSEVSTCQWEDSTAEGCTITKGDVIGAFHSGGSTHCLIFEREYARRLNFDPKAQYPEIATANLAVNSTLASL
ncbi:phosphatidylserine decarboxylase family protein [Aspergillus novofumigatus IBT 16806]|uniref:Putative phosphatidylserine decarboxylase n=1 Tax=Aspergillus novofumigatus (strain IBT 16806) TaxID=1392255 RepID=A0A2I1CF57_ASPN1|nr:putative phosphatidylserine decarboxylase [Aspergillus novofumigatus IBT 16806]PKX96241.1 putative phosphatidylserine decarboxylase [Aspergillus novofumigatus IBT 16806]